MILITNTRIYGWESAIRGMRNPMNSWEKSDTHFTKEGNLIGGLGKNDYTLAKKLADTGQVHGKYLRMITVTADITAPLYWWKEFDTYKVGTVSNSCSTMHKIHSKPFQMDDFSHEHLSLYAKSETWSVMIDKKITPWRWLELTIELLNAYREKYLATMDKFWWWQMIQTLPSSYNQKRTIQMNYAVLKEIYEYRKNHKLDEWKDFCSWIEKMPYSELITGGNDDRDLQEHSN